jgi:CubicO group peptidase (beta-lactamase class C family)
MYTAALLMRMVEEHKLGLDDSITKYISDAPAAWSKITVRNLATHTTGLGSVPIDSNVVSTTDAVHLEFKAAVVNQPGTVASYDSTDYTPLQFVLEAAGGKPYPQLLKEEILDPAGMNCTAFDYAEEHGPQRFARDIPGRAEYYSWQRTFNQRRWFLYTQYAYAAGGVYSCVQDIAKFLAAIDGGKLLSADSVAALETPMRLLDGSAADYGIGWVVGTYRGHRWVGHSGGPAMSDVMYFPDEHLGIIVLTNQQKLHPVIASLIADVLVKAPPNYLVGGIPDTTPVLTHKAERLLVGCTKGSVDASLFAPASRDMYVDDLNDIGPAWFGLFEPITRLILTADSNSPGGNRTRHYRVVYGAHVEGVTLTFDHNGDIVDLSAGGD